MAEPKDAVVAQWLQKAQRDLASARRLLQGDPPFLDTAVYHCQQAGEKALKAFLAARERPLRRVHDLVALVDEFADLDPSFSCLGDDAETLTPYGTAFRYPGEESEPLASDAIDAVRCAERILVKVPATLAQPA